MRRLWCHLGRLQRFGGVGSPRWQPVIFLLDIILFFFQAEDGIRDTSVTGVQTCALPICVGAVGRCSSIRNRIVGGTTRPTGGRDGTGPAGSGAEAKTGSSVSGAGGTSTVSRSEERRVGKEWR